MADVVDVITKQRGVTEFLTVQDLILIEIHRLCEACMARIPLKLAQLDAGSVF